MAVSIASQEIQRRPWSISSSRLRARVRRLLHIMLETNVTTRNALSLYTNAATDTPEECAGQALGHKGSVRARSSSKS